MLVESQPQPSCWGCPKATLNVMFLCPSIESANLSKLWLMEVINLKDKSQSNHNEPTIAPGMNTHDPLEEKATEEDIEKGDVTSVTRLYLDRTPED